jgi:hypothetical protein
VAASYGHDAAVRTGATFRLWSDHVGGSAVATRTLGLEPTDAFEIGDQVGRSPGNTRRVSLWTLSSGLPPDSELADHLEWLLERLEPRTAQVWRLVHDGYGADWFCLAASEATEHAVELGRPLLRRLVALPGDLLLDVMGED